MSLSPMSLDLIGQAERTHRRLALLSCAKGAVTSASRTSSRDDICWICTSIQACFKRLYLLVLHKYASVLKLRCVGNRAAGGGGGLLAKDALGNDVKQSAWLKTHQAGDHSLVQGLKSDATYLIGKQRGLLSCPDAPSLICQRAPQSSALQLPFHDVLCLQQTSRIQAWDDLEWGCVQGFHFVEVLASCVTSALHLFLPILLIL